MKQVLLSHPSGNTFVRQALQAFKEADLLERFCTGPGFSEDSMWSHLPGLSRRAFSVSPDKLGTRFYPEGMRLLLQALGLTRFTRHGSGRFSFDRSCLSHDAWVAGLLASEKVRADALYSYEDCCKESFEVAESLGIERHYELPIAYWETVQKILKEEAIRYPAWEPTLLATRDKPEKLARKSEELRLADHIICPSAFVKRSLPKDAIAGKQCSIIPYGSPITKLPKLEKRSHTKLRLLFVGALSQRKGLADLFAAMQLLNRSDVELIVMGAKLMPEAFYRSQYSDFTYESPRSNAEVLKLMQRCDLLVLPSLAEGRAIVQQEALACGLPLIVTPNAGGEDLITPETGTLVGIRSPEAIAKAISHYADNREALDAMRPACQALAHKTSWQTFRARLTGLMA